MATAAVIEFGSFSSSSGHEREFVDAGHDRCSREFEGIVGSSAALRSVLDKIRVVSPTDTTALMALDRLSRDAFEMGLYTKMKCQTLALMSEPRIKDLRHFALFSPFSCIESRQLATYRCKTETLEVIEKTEKTGLYG
jgi:hypothetical protein